MEIADSQDGLVIEFVNLRVEGLHQEEDANDFPRNGPRGNWSSPSWPAEAGRLGMRWLKIGAELVQEKSRPLNHLM